MATKIKNWAKTKTTMFEVVVFAVVSQTLDREEVQQQIAEGLGLKLEEQKNYVIRAEKLRARLMAAKSFLIILDDVWKKLDLAELGIPSKSTLAKRKLILTSRVKDALTATNDPKIFAIDILPDEEAWNLFREKAGHSIDAPNLIVTAREVAKQCKGLPLALVVVGSALRDTSEGGWKDALRQLERSNAPANIPGVLEELYVPLKWSFDQLPSEEARYIFLLCSLFPEDYEIYTETLVRYGWVCIFNGTENLREARDRVSFLVEILKSRFLLNHARDKRSIEFGEYVKMHDVIRNMAISIASVGRYVFMVSDDRNIWPMKDSYENYTHISAELRGNFELPESIYCPRVEFLRIGINIQDSKAEVPDNFFGSMGGLKVLSAVGFRSLPSSMCLLTSLRALYLHRCYFETASVVGKMVNLEILSLQDSDFEELPREIGLLKKLKVLDLTDCTETRKIAYGVISGLVKLEELRMLGCGFREWEVEEEGKQTRNASLVEIASLSSLVTLQMALPNPELISLDLPSWPKLETYQLRVHYPSYLLHFPSAYEKSIVIECEKVTPIGNFFCSMIRNAEYLNILGECCIGILHALVAEGFNKVKSLRLQDFDNVEYLVDAFHSGQTNAVFFAALESLELQTSESLKEICFPRPPIGSFGSLKLLYLDNLPELRHAFPLSKFQICSQLEELKIEHCDGMEEVFWEEEVEITTKNKIEFPKLHKLELRMLPKMEVFCKGIEELELPALQTLEITNLPKMTNFCSTEGNQFLFSKQVCFLESKGKRALIGFESNCRKQFSQNAELL